MFQRTVRDLEKLPTHIRQQLFRLELSYIKYKEEASRLEAMLEAREKKSQQHYTTSSEDLRNQISAQTQLFEHKQLRWHELAKQNHLADYKMRFWEAVDAMKTAYKLYMQRVDVIFDEASKNRLSPAAIWLLGTAVSMKEKLKKYLAQSEKLTTAEKRTARQTILEDKSSHLSQIFWAQRGFFPTNINAGILMQVRKLSFASPKHQLAKAHLSQRKHGKKN